MNKSLIVINNLNSKRPAKAGCILAASQLFLNVFNHVCSKANWFIHRNKINQVSLSAYQTNHDLLTEKWKTIKQIKY